jgi:aldose 1-epimerase
MATAEPVQVTERIDFRTPRTIEGLALDDLLTGRDFSLPNVIYYPDNNLTVEMQADPIFAHTLLYSPVGAPFFAIEPQSNANDGFALHTQGVPGSGVFVLSAGETATGVVRLRVVKS